MDRLTIEELRALPLRKRSIMMRLFDRLTDHESKTSHKAYLRNPDNGLTINDPLDLRDAKSLHSRGLVQPVPVNGGAIFLAEAAWLLVGDPDEGEIEEIESQLDDEFEDDYGSWD